MFATAVLEKTTEPKQKILEKKIVLYLNVFLMKRCNMMVAEANILASYNIITTTTT